MMKFFAVDVKIPARNKDNLFKFNFIFIFFMHGDLINPLKLVQKRLSCFRVLE